MKAVAVVLLLLSAAAVALLPWPVFDCGLCGRAQIRKQARNPNGYVEEPTSCPACRDRGRVSAWRLSRTPVLDARLRELLQKAAGETSSPSVVAAFQGLLADSGGAAHFCTTRACEFAGARFVRTDRGNGVLIFGEHATWKGDAAGFPIHLDVHSRQLWLFDLHGRLLDSVAFESRQDGARPWLSIGETTAGAQLEIRMQDFGSRSRRLTASLEGLKLWQAGIGEIPPERWFKEGGVRLRILGGRLVP